MTTTAFPIATPDPAPLKRCAIVGTAPSWRQTPWQDPGLHILGLNDAYVLGQPRADVWFDLHPSNRWLFYEQGKPPFIDDVSPGTYLRPKGHREWLSQRTFPVFLLEAKPEWPTSRTFPKPQVLDFWQPFWPYRVDRKATVQPGGDYETSSPAWIYMWAVAEGYREIHIYGIHLSTEWEYLEQRPNLEFLMGVGAGLGVKHILPTAAPICRGTFQYGYEPKATTRLEPMQRRIERLKHEGALIAKRLGQLRWYDRAEKQDVLARKAVVDLELQDAQMVLRQQRMKVA